MKDVQSELDRRNIPLKHVDIKNLRWPIALKDKEKGTQHTVAAVSLAVDLPHDLRGTHMSRFVECLQTLRPVTLGSLENILDHLKERLQAEKVFLQLKFPYFIYKTAPVSGQRAPMDIDCVYTAEKEEHFPCVFLLRYLSKPCVPVLKRSVIMEHIIKELWPGWRSKREKWSGWKNWQLLLMPVPVHLFTDF